jgi:hypothetical protein
MGNIITIEDLANHFRGLADGSIQPFESELGICNHISFLVDEGIVTEQFLSEFDEYINIERYYSGWDKFSGNEYYPVPSIDDDLTPEEEYELAYNTEGGMWEGTYGGLRKDLCLHIAKQLEKLI